MAILARGIPDLYDVGIDGKGYLLVTEAATPFAPMRSAEYYAKVGRDLQVPRQDFSEEMSENKVDDLYWTSQRSFYSGAGQKRLDAPQLSDDEAYLRSKNVDPFKQRGKLSLSNQIIRSQTGVSSGAQTKGYGASSGGSSANGRFWWISPVSGSPSTVQVRSASSLSGSVSSRSLTGFSTDQATGMCTDGEYLYVSGPNGVWRGLLVQPTVAMTLWKSQPVNDIAFVKDRIMGWRQHPTSGKLQIWELTDAASPQMTKEYNVGWTISSQTGGAQSVFAEIKGFICWIAQNPSGQDGYLWVWDGTDPPFQAAKFPGFAAEAVYSYAESVLYILASQPANAAFATDVNRWALIQAEVDSGGDVAWDVLHVESGDMQPTMVSLDTELVFPVKLPAASWSGLDSDAGVSATIAPTLASLNLINNGLNPAKHWGRTSAGAIVGVLFGDAGFTKVQVHVYRKQVVLVGENGEVRAEQLVTPAPDGQLLSSAIDKNIDHEKVFLLGELATEPLPAGTTAIFQYQTTDPDTETPVTFDVGSITGPNGKFLRERLSTDGVKSTHLHYRVTLTSSSGSGVPVVRKAGVGCTYGKKPAYEHVLAIKAMRSMSLRNGSTLWPKQRPPDVVQAELEELRDTQKVVDYQEPTDGADPRPSRKVQVKEVDIRKVFIPKEGWGFVINARLVEVAS